MSSDTFSNLGRRVGDLNTLPAEVRSQLSKNLPDKYDLEIIEIIDKQYDGYASADEILIAIYTTHQRHVLRSDLVIRLDQMKRNKFIYPISGKPDGYSTRKFHKILRLFRFVKSRRKNFYY